MMGDLWNILLVCKEHERLYAKHGITSRERDRNQGWIECSEFFFNNFELKEKTINKQKGE